MTVVESDVAPKMGAPYVAGRAYCDVAIVERSLPGRAIYTYHVDAPAPELPVGTIVAVPFGTRRLLGVVVRDNVEVPSFPTRGIEAVYSRRSRLRPQIVALCLWLASYYLAPLARVLALAAPVSGRPGWDDPEWTAGDPGSLPSPLLRSQTEAPRHRRATADSAQRVRLLRSDHQSTSRLGSRQRTVLASLRARPDALVDLDLLLVETGATRAVIETLVRRGYIACEPVARTYRARGRGQIVMSAAQKAIVRDLSARMDQPRPGSVLLHGVTASGKTNVYLGLMTEAVARGKQALVLVPEIALTPQSVHRFGAAFPGRVVALHGRLGAREKRATWSRIRDGHVDVVIGTRSALFAPVDRLGLIVIDEEHDASYKSPARPRLHARTVALRLAEISGVLAVLGSATPDVETWHRTRSGRSRLIELPHRIVGGADNPGPRVDVVDMRAAVRGGEDPIISDALHAALARALEHGRQSILLLNRRGTATLGLCPGCGYVPRCRRCDVALTYHGDLRLHLCHQCGFRAQPVETCPACALHALQYFGAGTQRVVEAVRQRFPRARVARWDSDVRGGEASHAITEAMLSNRIDILVGTQRVGTGLDFPGVAVAAAISADTQLWMPDYRAGERTFQMISQLIGRAGRGPVRGHVIVQTFNPDHPSIRAAAQGSYSAFVRAELAFRREHRYPPFADLVRAVVAARDDRYAEEQCDLVARDLTQMSATVATPTVDILGPVPCFHRRLRGQARWQLILRGDGSHTLARNYRWGPDWTVDVDPIALL